MKNPFNFLHIRKEKKGQIFLVTLDRPPVNALNAELLDELNSFCARIEKDENARVVIFTGEGKTFCAGADLKEREKMTDGEVEETVTCIRTTFARIAELPVPVICALNGTAAGGGLELALSADFRLASEEAKMGLRETALAIIPGGGGTQRLSRLIGENKAKWWIMTARMFSAEESLKDGVVNIVTEPEQLIPETMKLAEEFAEKGPLAIKQAKEAIHKGIELPLKKALELEKECYGKIIPTEDRVEGLKAFKEKRKPRYKGK